MSGMWTLLPITSTSTSKDSTVYFTVFVSISGIILSSSTFGCITAVCVLSSTFSSSILGVRVVLRVSGFNIVIVELSFSLSAALALQLLGVSIFSVFRVLPSILQFLALMSALVFQVSISVPQSAGYL